MDVDNLAVENHHSTAVHDAHGTTERNISNVADPCIPSKASPLVSSWLSTIHDSLASLLHWTGSYPAEIQNFHLAFLRQAVFPCLKLPPVAADRLQYLGTHHHGVYEASVAFTSFKSPKVRFAVQPLLDPNTTDDDPLGQKEIREKLESLASTCNSDRLWLDGLIDSVFLTTEEEGLVRKKSNGGSTASALPRHPFFVSFDLESDKNENGKPVIGMKAYLFPQLKALATGRKLLDVTDSVILRLADGDKGMLAAWKLLTTFLDSNGENIDIGFLAIDCLAPEKEPRVKVYVQTKFNSLASARHVLTLGGLLPPSSAEFLPPVWPLLMNMEDVPQANMDSQEKPLNDPDSRYCGLGFAFSLVPGKAIPQIKMYVSTWQYAHDEAGIIDRYQRILQTLGMKGNHDIGAAVQSAFKDKRETGLYTHISIISSAKGAELTTYLGPRFWE
ncbi:aromatic prenyltransferase [Colletotrichum truncatum]|uniref:Aromatic prenyltransferase n=1 Tax=Colletotrichum truncatum TaxID=5467 RepID=A0ACC3YU87_COLTU|nr:aromatic prenyltransferase [Colletotrichum truncatum]KAF6798691.1 aromatic prenyltransferase [Colletotrichum truncatum]